jgi:hypothetical protein
MSISLDSNLNQFNNENLQPFHLAVEQLIDFVNQHGGQNVCGWTQIHENKWMNIKDYYIFIFFTEIKMS